MTFEDLRAFCLKKPEVTESFPFDHTTLVFKVAGKMFALADVEDFTSVNLKSDPEKAIELRETFQGVEPGFHMNKKHWNTVSVHSDVPQETIYQMIDDSYNLVVASLPKRLRNELSLG